MRGMSGHLQQDESRQDELRCEENVFTSVWAGRPGSGRQRQWQWQRQAEGWGEGRGWGLGLVLRSGVSARVWG